MSAPAIASGSSGPRGNEVLHVDAAAPPGGDGASWATAFSDLQSALAVAGAGQEVRVADGTYKPTSGTDRSISFVIPSGVVVRGGFAGLGARDPDARDVMLFPTVLSGDLGVPNGTFDNSYRVVLASETAPGTMLDGVTIERGIALGPLPASRRGGGVGVVGGAVVLRDCTVRDCLATSGGAGLYVTGTVVLEGCSVRGNEELSDDTDYGGGMWLDVGSSGTVLDCLFAENVSDSRGGGIYADTATLSIANSTFSLCEANDGGGAFARLSNVVVTSTVFDQCGAFSGNGGGLMSTQGPLTVKGCVFTSNYGRSGAGLRCSEAYPPAAPALIEDTVFAVNSADYDGGGLYAEGPVVVRGSMFVGNKAALNGSTGQEFGGGGIMLTGPPAQQSAAVIVDCTFRDNAAPPSGIGSSDGSGGGIQVKSKALVVRSRFLKNTAREGGGVAVMSSDKVTLIDCEFSGNVPQVRGGAVNLAGGTGVIRNCTIAFNSASAAGAKGAGIAVSGAGGNLTMSNSILWGNSVGGVITFAAQILDEAAGVPQVDYCIVNMLDLAALPGSEGNNGLNPNFVSPLGPDGLAGTLDDSFAVQPISPAIDSGSNALVPFDVLDLDGDGDVVEFIPTDSVGAPRISDAASAPILPGCGTAGAPIVDRGSRESSGTGAAPLVGDFDGNGMRDGFDLGTLLSEWGPCADACCNADLDGDSFVTALDLAIFLGLPYGVTP